VHFTDVRVVQSGSELHVQRSNTRCGSSCVYRTVMVQYVVSSLSVHFLYVPVTLYTRQPMLNLYTFLGSVITVLSPTVPLTHHSTNLLKYSRVLIPSILLSLPHTRHRHRYFSFRRKRKFVRENEIRPVPRSSQTHVCVGNVLQASTPCTATTDGLFR
jgi:hypothetical protein